MGLVSTPAIILTTVRYGETSKIVRLLTRAEGMQSAIAKGAMRPRSRFGASLQVLSSGVAQYLAKDTRDLHILTAFDVVRLRDGLPADLDRYAAASTLAELVLKFAPSEGHPELFDLVESGFDVLNSVPPAAVDVLGLRILWQAVRVLGFAPSLEHCARDGNPVDPAGGLPFSARDGGALCPSCASQHAATSLPEQGRRELAALLDPSAELPLLDDDFAAAHRRLLARYLHLHLGEGTALPALDFWLRRPWAA